ncbi:MULTISPECIES: T9SS type A sorting domain-containing protein [unclassified Chryseobacterium]|uniref:T9SS type A sorting domain-containing protein n=1 Tax=unclassified Chryseobacterium TaxID=2593645 RepID=UPI00100AB103|nr:MULTISPECIES: T9SS type A sorting domain-containing protein [unclassified Chryseobacterium]RXM51960.1 hypothetical protein BOQ64_08830 [Chryseobacterium sp. CH25]RXM63881.1 hypothetical protein BOQ60_13205 [Chryseobacterium sp. CH1]
MKKFFYVVMINLLFGLSLSKAQTVKVSNSGTGQPAVYTFEYVTSGAIGTGTVTPNVFYFSLPAGFPAISPVVSGGKNLQSYVTFKVNGVSYPCSASFGTVGGSWSNGVQLSVSGATSGVVIPAGAQIQVVISGMIKNPTNSGTYTIQWRTAEGSGQVTQNFSSNISFSGTLATQEVKIKQNELSVYPNPAVDFIQVAGLGKTQKYTVYNSVGNYITEGKISEGEKINTHHFVSGVYFLKLENGNSVQFIRK